MAFNIFSKIIKFLPKNISIIFCTFLLPIVSCGRHIPYHSNHQPYANVDLDEPISAEEFQAQLEAQTPNQAAQALKAYEQPQKPYYVPAPAMYQQYGGPPYGAPPLNLAPNSSPVAAPQAAPAPASRLYNNPYAFEQQPQQSSYGDSDSSYVAPQYYNPEENMGYINYRNYKQRADDKPVF